MSYDGNGSYTETTTTSWFTRLQNSFSGIGTGLAMLIAGTILLWWNEGDFVATRDALNETQALTAEMSDITKIDPSLNGKVVHATGRAETKDVLTDSIFGVGDTAISLIRRVEYYQWTEESRTEKRQKLGGGEESVTTYSYSKKWVSKPVNSSSFHDAKARSQCANALLMRVEDATSYASNVTFGAYRLPAFLSHAIGGATPLTAEIPEETRKQLEEQIYTAYPQLRQGGGLQSTPANPNNNLAAAVANYAGTQAAALTGTQPALIHQQGNTIYVGRSSTTPNVGDLRVTFQVVYPVEVSIIAKVNGDTFEKYYSSNGKPISKLSMGAHSMESMFGAAHESNSTMTWILRAVGVFLVITGFKLILGPLSVIASVIPLLGSIVGAGTGFVSIVLGLAWSLVIMSIAWLRFRPLVGGIMLAVAAGLVLLSFLKGRGAKGAAAPAGPQGPAGPTA